MTQCGRIYAVYSIDERSGRYTAWRRRTCNTDSVSIPCKIRTVHADSVACTMLARLQHSVSVLSACATRTQYRVAHETPPHTPWILNREYIYAYANWKRLRRAANSNRRGVVTIIKVQIRAPAVQTHCSCSAIKNIPWALLLACEQIHV